MVSIIAAMAQNRIIGRNGSIPWGIPEDLLRFRELTMGYVLIMGRKTYESIGHPLPGRRCIVLSRQEAYRAAGCEVVPSLDEAIGICGDSGEIFVAGGEEVYRQTMPLARRLYITRIDLDCDGDRQFPGIPGGEFVAVSREILSRKPLSTLVIYERLPAVPGEG